MHLQSFWLYGTHCVKHRWLKKILLLNKKSLKCTTSSLPWCNKLLRYTRFDVTREHYSLKCWNKSPFTCCISIYNNSLVTHLFLALYLHGSIFNLQHMSNLNKTCGVVLSQQKCYNGNLDFQLPFFLNPKFMVGNKSAFKAKIASASLA